MVFAISRPFYRCGRCAEKTGKENTRKKTSGAKTVIPPLDVRAAREKVDNQLANVNRFVDVLGPIAQGIATLDESGKTKRLPKATLIRMRPISKRLFRPSVI